MGEIFFGVCGDFCLGNLWVLNFWGLLGVLAGGGILLGSGFCRNFGEICHFERSEKSINGGFGFLFGEFGGFEGFVWVLGVLGFLGWNFCFFWGFAEFGFVVVLSGGFVFGVIWSCVIASRFLKNGVAIQM